MSAIEFKDLPLSGLRLGQLKIWNDERGFFIERFVEEKMKSAGLTSHFIQDNHSRSHPGVLRGLHSQHSPSQGKLISVVRGRIWDVAVDLRHQSPTFGKWYGVEISDSNGLVFWIPSGFAHGFCVLGSEPADVMYKVDSPYSPKTELGLAWNDPDIKIEWPISSPLISDRDRALGSFKEYARHPIF
jgi:dTDP-4-dehydrorhamnose 3,5-epimerase